MRRLIPFCLSILFLVPQSFTADPLWVFLDTKATAEPVTLSPATLMRLARHGENLSWYDLPVQRSYLDSLRSRGFQIRTVSRWLNAVSVSCPNTETALSLHKASWVRHIRPLAKRVFRETPARQLERELDYGAAAQQIEMLGVDAAHARGLNGRGIRIAVFDSGFDLDHPVFDGINIIAEWDFVHNELNLDGAGDSHGTQVLSALGGYAPGELIGPAYLASFILARTENDLSETPTEEDFWVAALEWADSLGADIVSSSLVYREFDNPVYNYSAAEMNGETAVITQATDIAASRGILVVNAMGNEGPSSVSLWAPADGKHVLSVGALTPSGGVAYYSGRGPTGDGRIKPDVVALGSGVIITGSSGGYTQGYGTSFATPLVAGAAALYLQAFPSLPPDSVIAHFRASGSQAHAPDNAFGWGIPDLATLLGPLPDLAPNSPIVFPNPASSGELRVWVPNFQAAAITSIRLFDVSGRHHGDYSPQCLDGSEICISLNIPPHRTNQLYHLQLIGSDLALGTSFVFLGQP